MIVLIETISAAIRDFEDTTGICLTFFNFTLSGTTSAAEFEAFSTLHRAPATARVIWVHADTVHGSSEFRQCPEVMIHMATLAAPTRTSGGVLVPGSAGAEFPILHGWATCALRVYWQVHAVAAVSVTMGGRQGAGKK